jgi:hypothetical protein
VPARHGRALLPGPKGRFGALAADAKVAGRARPVLVAFIDGAPFFVDGISKPYRWSGACERGGGVVGWRGCDRILVYRSRGASRKRRSQRHREFTVSGRRRAADWLDAMRAG